jgi:hypothetical protein
MSKTGALLIAAIACVTALILPNFARASVPEAAAIEFPKGDYAKALQAIQPAANQGDKDAQSVLGIMYALGRGVPANEETAISWWKKAGNVGQGEYGAALVLIQGKPDPANEAAAMRWFQKSAQNGYWPSEMMTGTMFLNGRGAAKSPDQARYWYGKAADRGVSAAQIALAGLEGAQPVGLKWLLVLYRECLEGKVSIPPGEQKLSYCSKINSAANLLRSKLTGPQIAEGQNLASAWLAATRPALDPKEQQ